ncbi:Uncharacterised protein [Yersinia pekkanenii]|uniref:Uncharacterized protein n=1 Tax=Yersinia pekkanenii TaxID=1288385 RepID=A0A0T9PTL3_9GAMM|nr:hypothetical protein [Yersinia pekkanenii]CNH81397.1 Uncharacterised protein [Yersinia pekkanenii]
MEKKSNLVGAKITDSQLKYLDDLITEKGLKTRSAALQHLLTQAIILNLK